MHRMILAKTAALKSIAIACVVVVAGADAALSGAEAPSVRTAVLRAVESDEEAIRAAALRALGQVGRKSDVPLLARVAATAPGRRHRTIAFESLCRLKARGTDEAIAGRLSGAQSAERLSVK